MKKSAFTMLELVFVIVVIGILAAVFIPRFERDNAGEAAYQIARHIRLAQHYALVDDVYSDTNATWYKSMWQIAFTNLAADGGACYDVFTDKNQAGNVSSDEAAIDPLTHKPLFSANCAENGSYNDDVLLKKKFAVTQLDFNNCGGNQYIAFDHLGRPHANLTSATNYQTTDCVITLHTKDQHEANVTVYGETGFVKVTSIDGKIIP